MRTQGQLSAEINGKTILITGGTGSFGRTFVRRLLRDFSPQKVIILSRDEWKQWEMRQSDPIFNDLRIRYLIGDVRDKHRLMRAFREVDVVIHSAALKQVPVAEYNPSEFVQTNVLGAMNIIDAAIDCQVQKVIALSTDKAVNPINLYGATKLCSDKLFVAGNSYVGATQSTQFAVVRYGNVLGSRGSIIPMWKKMVAEGALSIPVTDARMTRFWITLEQAVDFVLESLGMIKTGGEIFVPKIPSMKIMDLAEAIAPHLPKTICGIREGEKLHELLICAEDARHCIEHKKGYTITPELFRDEPSTGPSHSSEEEKGNIPEGFIYASNTNLQWIGVDALRELIEDSSSLALA